MPRVGSYVEGVVTLEDRGKEYIQSDIESTLIRLGYTWLSGSGLAEDAFTSEWVKALKSQIKYPRFHLKVWAVKRVGQYLIVAVQVHLDIVKHESPMNRASIRQCEIEIERLGGWRDSAQS